MDHDTGGTDVERVTTRGTLEVASDRAVASHAWLVGRIDSASGAGIILRRIVELHAPGLYIGYPTCDGCDGAVDFPPEWPCRTVQVVIDVFEPAWRAFRSTLERGADE